MEITEKEYYELKMKVSSLQNIVDSLQSPRKTTIYDELKEKPISGVTTLENSNPIFTYTTLNSDAWNQAFLSLAKMIHKPSPMFYMDSACSGRVPYIRRTRDKNEKIKIADLTQDQIYLSVQMLNELIPIYNKYFKMTHQKVMYDPTGKCEYEPFGVVDADILKKERKIK